MSTGDGQGDQAAGAQPCVAGLVRRAAHQQAEAAGDAAASGSVQSGESASGDQPATGTTVPANSADSGWNPEAAGRRPGVLDEIMGEDSQ
jgi:hypothetical protein